MGCKFSHLNIIFLHENFREIAFARLEAVVALVPEGCPVAAAVPPELGREVHAHLDLVLKIQMIFVGIVGGETGDSVSTYLFD